MPITSLNHFDLYFLTEMMFKLKKLIFVYTEMEL